MARPSDVDSTSSFRLAELAELIDGSVEGDPELVISGIRGLDEARSGDLSFCAQGQYRAYLKSTDATAVIVAEGFGPPDGCRSDIAWVRVADPYLAMAKAIAAFHPPDRPPAGVHPTAVIEDGVELGTEVHVGPRAVVGARAKIGDRSVVGACCVLAAGVEIGNDCILYPNVTVYGGVRVGSRVIVHAGAVLGADGFGYAQTGDEHVKIPQVGGVVIEDDVEIGANACIDRATLGVTRVGRGAKIDNLVQIGHNCDVGANSVLCGQVGLGGTTRVGDGVLIGGQAGLRGHLRVGDGAMIAGQAGVVDDVPAGAQVAGFPHQEAASWRRVVAALRRLPELVRRVRRLEAAAGAVDKEEK